MTRFHRAWLHLRAERAFGLSAVVRRSVEGVPAVEAVRPSVVSVQTAVPAKPPPPAGSDASARLSPTGKSRLTDASPIRATPDEVAVGGGAAEGLFGGGSGIVDEGPFESPELPTQSKRMALQQLDTAEVRHCEKCPLCRTRTQTVFGEGDVDAALMFVGEAPGENEDLQGRPFVGRAGELLDRQIAAMGLRREQVYIANVLKCRPPGNRAPAPEETVACTPYLVRQIDVVRPKVIVTLGLPATQYLLRTKTPMGKLRGQWHTYRGIDVMPTYHPAYVLRNYTPETRKMVWSDLQKVMARLQLSGGSPTSVVRHCARENVSDVAGRVGEVPASD